MKRLESCLRLIDLDKLLRTLQDHFWTSESRHGAEEFLIRSESDLMHRLNCKQYAVCRAMYQIGCREGKAAVQ